MSVTLKGKAVTWGASGITFTAGIISSTSLHANQNFEGEWTAQSAEVLDETGRLATRFIFNRQKKFRIQCVPYGATVAIANTSAKNWLPSPGTRVIAGDAQGTGFKTAYDVLNARQVRTNTSALIAELDVAEAPSTETREIYSGGTVVSGSQQITRQPDEKEYIALQGWVTVEVYEGPREAIEGAALALSANTAYSRLRTFATDGPKYRLHATVGGFDGGTGELELVNTWELLGNTLQNDIFDHEKARAISDSELADILEYLNDPTLRKTSSPPLSEADAIDLWALVKNNKLHYQDFYFSLRHTLTATSYADIAVSMAGIRMRWALGSIPSSTAQPGFAAAVNLIAPWFAAASGFEWGWLKQPPQITQTFQGRPQVVTEWWYYAWSTFLYDAYP